MGSLRDPMPVAVALGSNLGDRGQHLRDAVTLISQHIADMAVSPFHETVPVGVPGDQPLFLNAAAIGRTRLSPEALLDALLDAERRLGRTRPFPNAARTIDLDLILYGGEVITTPRLTVPHPRFRLREFVLVPLTEVAPDWIDPLSGQTISDLLVRLRAG